MFICDSHSIKVCNACKLHVARMRARASQLRLYNSFKSKKSRSCAKKEGIAYVSHADYMRAD